MRPREAAGHINRAKGCYVFVTYDAKEEDAEGCWLRVTKTQAKELVDDARETGVEDFDLVAKGRDVFIGGGGDDEIEDETPEGEADGKND